MGDFWWRVFNDILSRAVLGHDVNLQHVKAAWDMNLVSFPDSHSKKKNANHILIPQVICFFISVSKLLTFWYRYEKTDHL